jgi:rhomboid-like protein
VFAVSFGSSFIYHYEKRRREGNWSRDRQNWGPWDQREHGVVASFVEKLKRKWRSMSYPGRVCVSLIGVNCCVFLLWRIPALQRSMAKWFLSDPHSRRSLPLLLSGFSHIEALHLRINMLVLWNFFLPYLITHGPEIGLPYYVSAGVFASFVGHVAKVARRTSIPSLGASGSLMAVVASITYQFPDSSFYIIFLPFVPIPAVYALGAVVALDVTGLIMGWRYFDHAAHLGGVLFGVLFESQVLPRLPQMKTSVIQKWKELTESTRSSR